MSKRYEQLKEAIKKRDSDGPLSLSGEQVIFTPKNVKMTGLDMKDNSIVSIISTDALDRYDDTMDSKGALVDNYMRNPVVLWAHSHSIPAIANCSQLATSSHELVSKTKFHLDTELSRELWSLVSKGILSGWSVGFDPKEWDENDEGGFSIKEWELLEYSLCNVPANHQALTLAMKSMRQTLPTVSKLLKESGFVVPDLVATPVEDIGKQSKVKASEPDQEFNEEESMTLVEFFEANPGVKKEYEDALKKAQEKGFTAGRHELDNVVKRVSPILGSPDYPQTVKAVALEAISGEKSIETFEAVITTFDVVTEKKVSEKAVKDTDASGDVPPEPNLEGSNADVVKMKKKGIVCDEESTNDIIKKMKGGA